MPGPDSAPVVAVMATALAGVLLIFVLLFALDAVIWERWMLPQVVGDTERVREMMETDGYCWTWWGGDGSGRRTDGRHRASEYRQP